MRRIIAILAVVAVTAAIVLNIGIDRRPRRNFSTTMAGPIVIDTSLRLVTLAATEDLRIDGDKETFVSFNQVRISASGVIIVPQPQDYAFLIYSPEGRRVGRFGGKGSGPGEFSGEQGSGWIGDTLWVRDKGNKISEFDANGKLISHSSIAMAFAAPRDLPDIPAFFANLSVQAVAPDGDYLVWATPWKLFSPASWTYQRPLISVGPLGMINRVIGDFPLELESNVIRMASRGGASISNVPFMHRPLFRIAPDGTRIIYVTTIVDSNDGGRLHLLLLNSEGDTLVARDYPFAGTRIPPRTLDSVVGRTIVNARFPAEAGGANAWRAEAMRRAPPFYAPAERIELGRDSTIWLGLRATGETRLWLILDSKGTPSAMLTLPADLFVSAASRSQLWGVRPDSNDVPSVVRYSLSGWRQ